MLMVIHQPETQVDSIQAQGPATHQDQIQTIVVQRTDS